MRTVAPAGISTATSSIVTQRRRLRGDIQRTGVAAWVDFSGATNPVLPAGMRCKRTAKAPVNSSAGSAATAIRPPCRVPNYICKDNGVKWGVKNEVYERINKPYPLNIVRIPLMTDRPRTRSRPPADCTGRGPHLRHGLRLRPGRRCAERPDDLRKERITQNKCYDFKVIQMAVSCDMACNTGCGTSGGGEASVRGVGLVP